MKAEVISNADLYFEHKLWKGELFFWKDEIESFKKRLMELVNQWTKKDVLAQLEHYQNQFMIHESKIDDLKQYIDAHEINMAEISKKGKDILNLKLVKKHIECRNHLETERHIYSELKKEFFKFLSTYM